MTSSISKDLLIEFFSEEIPARMQRDALEKLRLLFEEKMGQFRIPVQQTTTYITPRRLVLWARGVPETQEDVQEERRGPRTDAAPEALAGFLGSLGLTLDECEKRETPKGSFYFAHLFQKGLPVKTLLPQIIQEIIFEFPWPKSMRWAGGTRTWVRPLHHGLCLFGEEPVFCEIWMGPEGGADVPCVVFDNTTVGHRFLAPEPFEVTDIHHYQKKLHESYVVLDREDRKQRIIQQCQEKAHEVGCRWIPDEKLLEEVVGLVEWPVAYRGRIDPASMDLPPEVLMTSMRVHQRYFALETTQGHLAPYFITIANTPSSNQGQEIIRGNERVLKARLSDASFFYEQDRKQTLENHATALKNVIFHEKLGTLSDKIHRLKKIALNVAPQLGLAPGVCSKMVDILKADLTTQMVGEFPELQGTMGKYYALAEGYPVDQAQALEDHYAPRGIQDGLPKSLLGCFFGLIDRLETLIGFFGVGIRPTGSKDPYGLRRTALGILRLLENDDPDTMMSLTVHDLDEIFLLVYGTFGFQEETASPENQQSKTPFPKICTDVKDFLQERLKIYWRDHAALSPDVMDAVLGATQVPFLQIPLLKKRCQALQKFLKTDHPSEKAHTLIATYRRASHIVHIAEQADRTLFVNEPQDLLHSVDQTLFSEPAEKELFKMLEHISPLLRAACDANNFPEVLESLIMVKPALDRYFDEVTVNTSNDAMRKNRLQILNVFRALAQHFADFSKLKEVL